MIPASGLLQVFQGDEGMVDPDVILNSNEAAGTMLSLTISIFGQEHGTVHWCMNRVGPINERAREAMAMVSGVHMIFTGPVLFEGFPAEKVFEIVSALSRKEE